MALPIAAALAVLTTGVISWTVTQPDTAPANPWTPAAPGEPFLTWPASGNALTDRGLVHRAVQAWDTAEQARDGAVQLL